MNILGCRALVWQHSYSDRQGCQVHHLSMSEIPSMTKVAKKKKKLLEQCVRLDRPGSVKPDLANCEALHAVLSLLNIAWSSWMYFKLGVIWNCSGENITSGGTHWLSWSYTYCKMFSKILGIILASTGLQFWPMRSNIQHNQLTI